MSITSVSYLLFLFGLLIAYYLVPKKAQWIVLLLASLAFYLLSSLRGILFVLVTASTIYGAARWMDALSGRQKDYLQKNKQTLSKDEKASYKEGVRRRRRAILVCTLVLNFGILCAFKYMNFLLEQAEGLARLFSGSASVGRVNWVAPLGISFYTFQATGYLVDVYWGNCAAEKNWFRNLLFVSFFPQVTQGPISDHEALCGELFREHSFRYENYAKGGQRLLWGLAKKMVLANMLSTCVRDVFANYSSYSGLSVLIGAFCYSVQIYADFSGYMDIMCGSCQMLDIRLTENFERPYFSKSIAEYWRRWHISLGVWFKKYIYYPLAVAKWNRKLGSRCQKRLGKHFGRTLPATIALIVVWLTTGLWHGANWAYIAWGGVNGLFIIFSLWMEPVYDRCKKGLRVKESSFGWRAFQVIRTFFLVTLIKVLPEVGSLKDGFGLVARIFTRPWLPDSARSIAPFFRSHYNTVNILLCTAVLFVSSLLQRKQPLRTRFEKVPIVLRVILLAMLLVYIIFAGIPATVGAGGFLYEQF